MAVTPSAPTRDTQLIAVFDAISRILAVRALLLLGLIGAFVLAVMAMQNQSAASLEVLIAYAALVIIPLVWLEVRGKRGV